MSNKNIYDTFNNFLQVFEEHFKLNIQEIEFDEIQMNITSKSKITSNYKR